MLLRISDRQVRCDEVVVRSFDGSREIEVESEVKNEIQSRP